MESAVLGLSPVIRGDLISSLPGGYKIPGEKDDTDSCYEHQDTSLFSPGKVKEIFK